MSIRLCMPLYVRFLVLVDDKFFKTSICLRRNMCNSTVRFGFLAIAQHVLQTQWTHTHAPKERISLQMDIESIGNQDTPPALTLPFLFHLVGSSELMMRDNEILLCM